MVNVNDERLVFYIFRLRPMTESTWKILKLDLKTPGFFFPKGWEPCPCHSVLKTMTLQHLHTL